MSRPPYALAIVPEAQKEWARLDGSVKRRFKEKLAAERLLNPRVEKDALRELPDCYKIKIVTPQFRLVYHVDDVERVVTLLAISTRDDVYAELRRRMG